MLISSVNQFIDSLDPVLDKIILGRCNNLLDRLSGAIKNNREKADEYAVISQGDCRSNNLMFLYNDQNQPIDVKLIDWQCIRYNSPLLDFSYFFYTLSTKETLDKIKTYLNFYYESLCERIIELGSDPKKLFPREVFIDHWRKFAPFGLALSFCVIKLQLFEKDEVPDFFEKQEFDTDSLTHVNKNHKDYIDRVKVIMQHFIDNNLI
nr:uncharacterized protein LOC111429212 [Onthophagus taurus]